MTSPLMWSACRVYSASARAGFRRIASCLPRFGNPITLQSCHRKTCQDSSEQRKLTQTLTLWRLHLEGTSAPPTCLCLRVFSITQPAIKPARTHTQETTLQTLCAHWLAATTDCSTSQTPFQTQDNWLTAHWVRVAARNTCFIYQPAGVCQGHYGFNMDNSEVYLNRFRH